MDKQLKRLALLPLLACTLAAQIAPIVRGKRTNYTKDAACVGAWTMAGKTSTASVLDTTWYNEYDLSANAVTLTRNNTGSPDLTARPPGYMGASRKFLVADTDYFVAADGTKANVSGETATITISAWINPTAPANTVLWPFVSKYNPTGNQRQYFLGVIGTGSNQYKIQGAVSGNGTGADSVLSATVYTQNVWHHVALVDNNTDLRIYVDGVLDSTPIAHTSGIFSSTAVLNVGRYVSGPTYYVGYIDELAIFSRALGASEVLALKSSGIDGQQGRNDLAFTLYWPTDASISTTAAAINTELDGLCTAWSLTCATAGASVSGINIRYAVVNPLGVYTIIIIAGIHGTERYGPRIALDTMRYILTYNPLYAGIRFIIAPVVNPDGWNGGVIKNNNQVNINRNFSAGWAHDAACGSDTVSAYDYRGASAASEPETQAIQSLSTTYGPRYVFSIHGNIDGMYGTNGDASPVTPINAFLAAHGFRPLNYHSNPVCGMHPGFVRSLGVLGWDWEWGYDETDGNAGRIHIELQRFIATLKSVIQTQPTL